jgi:hypothetical protein
MGDEERERVADRPRHIVCLIAVTRGEGDLEGVELA